MIKDNGNESARVIKDVLLIIAFEGSADTIEDALTVLTNAELAELHGIADRIDQALNVETLRRIGKKWRTEAAETLTTVDQGKES